MDTTDRWPVDQRPVRIISEDPQQLDDPADAVDHRPGHLTTGRDPHLLRCAASTDVRAVAVRVWFRHTHATARLLPCTAPHVSRRLGHRLVQTTTATYAHVTTEAELARKSLSLS